MDPSDFHPGPGCFHFLIQFGWWPPHLPGWISSTGQQIFKNMPTLLPRESMAATSVVPATIQRPSPSVHRVGFSTSFTRLLMGSLALRPALLLCGNSRPRVAATPFPHATGAYGQLPGRDFNPLDLLLLLRTDASLLSLVAIAKLMLAAQNYRFSPDGEKAFGEYIRLRMTMKYFANARSVRNALDRARLRQANRLFKSAKRSLTSLDLMTIEAEDIRASRVFHEGTTGRAAKVVV